MRVCEIPIFELRGSARGKKTVVNTWSKTNRDKKIFITYAIIKITTKIIEHCTLVKRE